MKSPFFYFSLHFCRHHPHLHLRCCCRPHLPSCSDETMRIFPLSFFGSNRCRSFICNADEIDFDKYTTAMRGEDKLRPGQLYFQLPESWLKRWLMA
ncbi:hypothetical protein HanRHA438_Chr11g0513461 [Helianthus annuus]|nr:hypothetical protein HanRHA438_Chr11g0513461 [Helianthus annuus]